MSESDWLRPSPSDLKNIAAQYTDIHKLPTLDGKNVQTTSNFLSPCWNWDEDHLQALRVIAVPHTFPINNWMADLDADAVASHDDVSKQIATPSRNNQFSPLISQLEQVEYEWESTYSNEDQELQALNRRLSGSGILSMILLLLLVSACKPLFGTDYYLRFRTGSFTRTFPMANVPYRWKARICGAIVLANRRQSQVPVLVCLVDANLAEIVGAMISMVADNIKTLRDGIVEQEAFCINLSRPGTLLNFSAALFSAEYLLAARSSAVLPLGIGLVVRQTRTFDLRVPGERVEVARYVRAITQYLTNRRAKIGQIQKIIRDAKQNNM